MIDLEQFVATGVFPGVDEHSSTADVEALGEPDFVEPARKSAPKFLVYGDLEFRLRDDRLITVALKLFEGEPVDGGSLAVTGFGTADRRTTAAVGDLLSRAGTTYRVDELLSDPGSPVWITEHRVHLGFADDTLTRAAAEYGPHAGARSVGE